MACGIGKRVLSEYWPLQHANMRHSTIVTKGLLDGYEITIHLQVNGIKHYHTCCKDCHYNSDGFQVSVFTPVYVSW